MKSKEFKKVCLFLPSSWRHVRFTIKSFIWFNDVDGFIEDCILEEASLLQGISNVCIKTRTRRPVALWVQRRGPQSYAQLYNNNAPSKHHTYRILIVHIDCQSKRPCIECLARGKCILKGSLPLWLNSLVVAHCSELQGKSKQDLTHHPHFFFDFENSVLHRQLCYYSSWKYCPPKNAIPRSGVSHVLNIEAVVLWVSEGCIHSFNNELFVTFVGEPDKQSHHLSSWELCDDISVKRAHTGQPRDILSFLVQGFVWLSGSQ